MSSSITEVQSSPATFVEPLSDEQFKKTAFVVSALVLFIFSPIYLILGAAITLMARKNWAPLPPLQPGEKIITVQNTVFAIVGAMAAFLRGVTLGMLGGGALGFVPLIGAFGVGQTVYRVTRSF